MAKSCLGIVFMEMCERPSRGLGCLQVSTDWVGLIDEWARRFFHELDYEREARSAMQFKEQMEPLGGITVAPVYTELTSGEVLTTAWVQGKLFGIRLQGARSVWVQAACLGSGRSGGVGKMSTQQQDTLKATGTPNSMTPGSGLRSAVSQEVNIRDFMLKASSVVAAIASTLCLA